MKSKVINITDNDRKEGSIVNTLISTLRRTFGASLFGESPDGKRNYNTLFGYLNEPSYADYRGMYRRGGIAHTVVSKIAKACWRDVPVLKDGDNKILEDVMDDLKEAGFFKALERADILNRIGRMSVMFIGVQDGLDGFALPIGIGGDIEDLYFNVYGEDGINISRWETDPTSPRFGLPVVYQLTVTNLTGTSGKVAGFKAVNVHYSRIVHMAEGALENDVEGMSALEPVWNALIDKDKVRGASAEAFYRNARQKFALTANKDANFDTGGEALQELATQVEAFTNNQQDFLRLKNMEAKVMQPQISSPRDSYDITIAEISGQTGIPARMLSDKGSGELKGSEEKASWNGLVLDRQDQECTLWFMNGLRILEEANVIKPLPDKINVEWPVQSALSEVEKAEVNDKKASALQKIAAARSVSGGDEIDLESALIALDLEDIEIDDTVATGTVEDDIA